MKKYFMFFLCASLLILVFMCSNYSFAQSGSFDTGLGQFNIRDKGGQAQSSGGPMRGSAPRRQASSPYDRPQASRPPTINPRNVQRAMPKRRVIFPDRYKCLTETYLNMQGFTRNGFMEQFFYLQ